MPPITSIKSPADVANNAFTRMGYKLRLGSLLDGSDHAQHCIDVYAQVRDEMLASFDYDFAVTSSNLTLLKSAPSGGYFPPTTWDPVTYPPVGFLYEYQWPDDALKIRSVRFQPLFIINYDPTNNGFTEYNDTSFTPARRTIVTNVPSAIATYTRRITDPATWDVRFADALAARLSVLLAPALVGLDSAKLTTGEAMMADNQSRMADR